MVMRSSAHYAKWVEKKVASTIAENLKVYKIAFWSFVAGFCAFISLGLINEGAIFRSIIKSIYPPELIYKDVVQEFLKDEEFKTSLVNKTDYSKLEIKGAGFDTFPALNTALPDKVWNTMVSADTEKYEELVSKREFYEALKVYHSDITKSFLTPSNNKLETIAKIEKVKDVQVDVQILMAGKKAETKKTAKCYNWFKNDEYHVELVIPATYPDYELSWFRCDLSWPEIQLKLVVGGTALKSPVKLVGARRNGKATSPVLLISQKIAEELKLDNWEEYKSKAFGSVSVASAK